METTNTCEFFCDFVDVIKSLLTTRQLYILDGRFGITGEKKTLKRLSKELKISPERVRQIEYTARRILKYRGRSKNLQELLRRNPEWLPRMKSGLHKKVSHENSSCWL